MITYDHVVAPHGGIKGPTNVSLRGAVASVVEFITGDGQNVPRSSAWENLPEVFFPLAYSDSAQ